MPITRLATPDDVSTQISKSIAKQETAFFVCFGSEDPGTGESWCSDCVTADPVLRSACSKLSPDITLYECPVGERSAWKQQPLHPYRLNPVLRLERIPTLIALANGLERGRLVESDCSNPDVVAAFVHQSNLK